MKILTKILIGVSVFVLINLTILTPAHSSVGRTSNDYIKERIVYWSKIFNVEPAFAISVAHVESRIGNNEFRCGLVGKGRFYAPFNIHRNFSKKWGVNLNCLDTNIKYGCRSLSMIKTKKGCIHVGSDLQLQKRRLMTYNATFNGEYWKAIVAAKRKYSYYNIK
jgi:hypothetical protein